MSAKSAIAIYVVGSVVTLAITAALLRRRRYKAAAAVIAVSPFPLPIGRG